MTIEELQAELSKANEKIEALANSKATILDEKKKLEKQYKDIDKDEYFKLRDDYDKLEAENKKLEKANNVLAKDFEKVNSTLEEKEGNLKKLLIDDGIAKSLNSLEKHKLNDGALELAILDIKNKGVELIDGVPMVGDVAMADYISNDWLQSPTSKNLVTQNPNVGGGANGGNGSGVNGNIDRKNMTPDQLMAAGREQK